MSRIVTRLAVAAAFFSLAACNDTHQPVALNNRQVNYTVITPGGTLDQNITSLLGLFQGNGALAQWKNVKRKYSDGLSDPQQMKVAKQMEIELVKWVKNHASEMSTPPAGETTDAAAARVILYMSMYIYNGPTFVPPVYTPAADVAVTVVEPTQGDTIVTPADVAGIGLEAGSVAEPTIIVITQNPTPYPANCSGPLLTKLCQYPRFYTFNEFPHVKLLKQAKISVCHINGGTERTPLADHDRFRLAHTLPADLADTTPGGTVRNTGGEAIEILPLIAQTFVTCGDVEFTAGGLRHTDGPLTRLAKRVGKFFTPTTAYAIDQGFGGGTFDFSDFNDVDPQSAPDRQVDSASYTPGPYYRGQTVTVTYTVKNTGTGTGAPTPVDVVLSPDTTLDPSDPTLATMTTPSLVPGDSVTQTLSFVIPATASLGSSFLGIRVGDDPVLPEADLTNNQRSAAISVGAPDRRIQTATFTPGPYHPADHVAVNFVTKNVGSVPSTPTTVSVILSPDSAFDPSDLVLATAPEPALNAGDSIGQVIGFQLPGSFPASTMYLGIRINDDPLRPESDLTNNKAGNFGSYQPPFTTLANKMSVGALSVCALNPASLTLCWGDNATLLPYRQYGNASVGSSFTPVFVGGPSLVSMGVGSGQFHCGINSVNTGICWGRSGSGQIPNGTAGVIANNPTTMAGGISWRAIKASRVTGCGVSVTGAGYCWGLNQRGEIGSTSIPIAIPPAPVTIVSTPHLIDGGFNWKSVVAGWLHACGITVSGDAYCWGDNQAGQIGVGTIDTVQRRTPTLVLGGHHWIQLALGTRSTCGITDTHQAYCWGENFEGQLGNGTVGAPAAVPMAVSSPLRFSFITVSSGFGDGSAVTLPFPGQGNNGITCALTERGEAYCWGWNGNGSLGNGTTVDQSTPVQVLGGHIFTNLAAGGSHVCGAFFNQIWCWGSNMAGQLGNGTTANMSSVPLLVATPFNVP